MERWVDFSTGTDATDLSAGWKNIRLGSVVRFLDTAQRIDPAISYPLAGVRLDGAGVYHRETVRGTDTSATYLTPLQPGALIYSRLFAWRGAFAVVRDEHAGLWCSNEFPQFVCDASELSTDYLCLWALSNETLRSVEKRSVGTSAVSRNRFKEREFLELPVSLPPLATQRQICAAWHKSQTEVAAARARADAIEAKARAAFLAGLGLHEPAAISTRKAFALDFARLDRWGVGQVRASLATLDLTGGKFPIFHLRDVIADLENGWSPKCHSRPATPEEWGVLKLNAITGGVFDETQNKALPQNFTPKQKLEIKAGDILITRGSGAEALVASCVLVDQCRPRLMISDLVFRVIPMSSALISAEYLTEILKSRIVRSQIETASSGASTTMKKVTKGLLLALRLPLPPLAVQQKLVAAAKAARTEATRERAAADRLEASAATKLEAAVLGT